MEKGIDLKVQELKEKIIQNINEAKIPAVVVKYLLVELLQNAQQLENMAISQQKEEYEKEREKECQQEQQT